jgi:predicted nuclease of predicted toxin-antitoxin system
LKFLIDECLSVGLARMAVAAGHAESAHIAHRGLTGWKDHQLMKLIIYEDWTLVTRNSDDFRPRTGSASKAPCYLGQPIHAGLVCLNLPAGTGRADQEAYFEAAVRQVGLPGDLVNMVLEVDPGPQGKASVVVRLYDFPNRPD